jgi:hypothetical protein
MRVTAHKLCNPEILRLAYAVGDVGRTRKQQPSYRHAMNDRCLGCSTCDLGERQGEHIVRRNHGSPWRQIGRIVMLAGPVPATSGP